MLAKLNTKVRHLVKMFGDFVVYVAGNEQKPYTQKELELETLPMPTKKVSGLPQVGDYHFAIKFKGLQEPRKLAFAVERKEVGDFHNTLIMNHKRFNREIDRFRRDPTLQQFYVFVEGSQIEFLRYIPPVGKNRRRHIKNYEAAKREALWSLQSRGIHICFNGSRAESCNAMKSLVFQYAVKNWQEWLLL